MSNENYSILSDLGLDLGYSSQRFDDYQDETDCTDSHRDLVYAAMAGNETAAIAFNRLVRVHLGQRWAQKLVRLGINEAIVCALYAVRLEHSERSACNRARQFLHSSGKAVIDFDPFGPLYRPEFQEVSW